MNIPGFIVTQALTHDSAPFLSFEDRIYSYRDIELESNRAANFLTALGAVKGDRIALILPNCPEFIFFYLGITKLGAVSVPVQTQLSEPEMHYTLTDAQVKIVISTPLHLEMLKQLSPKISTLHSLVMVYTEASQSEALVYNPLNHTIPTTPPTVELDDDDDAVQIYSMGTSGKPKGVVLTHKNIVTNAQQIQQAVKLNTTDVMFCVLEMHHVFGMMGTVLAPFAGGATVILAEGFSARKFWRELQSSHATIFTAVPTIFSILLNLPLPRDFDGRQIRVAISGGSALAMATKNAFEEMFRIPIVEGYGLTEATCACTLNPLDGIQKPKSIGLPLPEVDMRIELESGKEAPRGTIGELVVRGPNVMKTYFQRPEDTTEILSGGWLHTGDLGYQDNDAYFFIVGRKKDMIIRGGENIYPREIENVLTNHPNISEAAVIGIPDEIYGEEVMAFIVPRTAPAPSTEEIQDFCRAQLAEYKIPTYIEYIEKLPRNPRGAVLKSKLKETYCPGRGPSSGPGSEP